MAVKIKVRTNFSFKKNINDARTKASRTIKKEMVEEILSSYDKGISPVSGHNAYKKYRPSTAKKKRRFRPVTLKDTGELHSSLKAIQKTKKRILLTFVGARNQRIAGYHQKGTANMAKRPMLPKRGQKFKKRIIDRFLAIINKNLKLNLKKR